MASDVKVHVGLRIRPFNQSERDRDATISWKVSADEKHLEDISPEGNHRAGLIDSMRRCSAPSSTPLDKHALCSISQRQRCPDLARHRAISSMLCSKTM
jgi:hypothetical protein